MKIETQEDLEEFTFRLAAYSIEMPINSKIVIELEPEHFAKIIPHEMAFDPLVEFNTKEGITIHLKRKE